MATVSHPVNIPDCCVRRSFPTCRGSSWEPGQEFPPSVGRGRCEERDPERRLSAGLISSTQQMQTQHSDHWNKSKWDYNVNCLWFHFCILIHVFCLVQHIPSFKARSIASPLYLIQVFQETCLETVIIFAVLFAATGDAKVTHFSFKGILHPKMKIFVFHLPPCRSEPVKALLVFRTQFKIFWMKTGRFVTVPLTAK